MDVFLTTCLSGDVLFYTDLDFLFIMSRPIPCFLANKSVIMTRGCLKEDENQLMVGNMIILCDANLRMLPKMWLASAMVSSAKGEFNDEQHAFNVISSLFGSIIQEDPFMRYDSCNRKEDAISTVGIHFPGGDKLRRVQTFINESRLTVG